MNEMHLLMWHFTSQRKYIKILARGIAGSYLSKDQQNKEISSEFYTVGIWYSLPKLAARRRILLSNLPFDIKETLYRNRVPSKLIFVFHINTNVNLRWIWRLISHRLCGGTNTLYSQGIYGPVRLYRAFNLRC